MICLELYYAHPHARPTWYVSRANFVPYLHKIINCCSRCECDCFSCMVLTCICEDDLVCRRAAAICQGTSPAKDQYIHGNGGSRIHASETRRSAISRWAAELFKYACASQIHHFYQCQISIIIRFWDHWGENASIDFKFWVVDEALSNGVQVAVCSTSNERAVSTIVQVLLGPEIANVMQVFAGDVVPQKKPSPDIYELAANKLQVDPKRWEQSLCICILCIFGFIAISGHLAFPRWN